MYRYQNSKHFWFEHFIHLLLIYFISYISSLYIIIFLLSLYHYIYKYIYSYLSIHYLSIHYIYLIHIYKICTDQNSKHFWFEHFIHLLLIYFISTLYIIIFYYHYITIRGCSKPSSRIYDIKNLVAFGHKQSWRPPAAKRRYCDFNDVVASGHNQLWRPPVAKFRLWFQEKVQKSVS